MTLEDPKLALLARYERQPIIRGLVQLVPFGIGSFVETTLLVRFQAYRTDRLREFFDELETGGVPLTPELVESNDFLHCYFATLGAVVKSRRKEKARYLARLLKSALAGEGVSSVDEYEELLSIIDELSYRELSILSLLARHERATPRQEGENELQRAGRFWPTLAAEAEKLFGVSGAMLQSILVRLQRSGCYEEFVGGYWDYTGGRGRLTPLYFRLEQIAGDISEVVA